MNDLLKGSIFVAIAASCYGMLTTFVKLAYQEGFTPKEVTFSQLAIGLVFLVILNLFVAKKHTQSLSKSKKMKDKFFLALSGTSLGFTSIFYYLAMQHITVSVGIVLLMQSVWMGVVLDVLINKVKPTRRKIISVLIILAGTILAADLLFAEVQADLLGVFYGFLAGLSYTITIFTSNRVALGFHSVSRSKWMMVGGFVVVGTYAFPELIQEKFNWEIFLLWGPVLALFGTVLPPLFFTAGMPKVNVGLGAIVSAIELPVAVLMGYFILNEEQNIYKWIGILMILSSIVFMNFRKAKKLPA
ncbi:MAG: EamA family transporter [Bacteroidota bacterium]